MVFLGALGALGALVAVLVAAGDGPLAAAPTDPRMWATWLQARPPEAAALAVVRLLALAAAVDLVAACVGAFVAGAARAHGVAAALERLAVPGARGVVRAAAAVGIALAGLVPATAAAQVAPADDPPVLRPLDEPAEPAGPSPPNSGDFATATVDNSPEFGGAGTATAGSWHVEPGDHLWAVAERTLAGAWGRPPSDAEVVLYWVDVIEANRSRLADPANPDLIFPGQVLVVPPPPAA
jgi:nucleoid-associated protein YgaU